MPKDPLHKKEDNLWVGEQIKNLRKKNDKTQVNVSEAMGDPAYQKYLSGYENGVDHMPIPVFFAIIEALDASPLELIPPRLFGEDYDVFTVYKSLNKAHQEAARAFIQKLKEAEGAK